MPRHRLEPDGWDEAEEKIAQYLLLLQGRQKTIMECIKLDRMAHYSSLSHKQYLNQRQSSIKRSKDKFIQARNAGSNFHTTYQPLPEDFTPLQYIRPNKSIYQGITKGMFCQMLFPWCPFILSYLSSEQFKSQFVVTMAKKTKGSTCQAKSSSNKPRQNPPHLHKPCGIQGYDYGENPDPPQLEVEGVMVHTIIPLSKQGMISYLTSILTSLNEYDMLTKNKSNVATTFSVLMAVLDPME